MAHSATINFAGEKTPAADGNYKTDKLAIQLTASIMDYRPTQTPGGEVEIKLFKEDGGLITPQSVEIDGTSVFIDLGAAPR